MRILLFTLAAGGLFGGLYLTVGNSTTEVTQGDYRAEIELVDQKYEPLDELEIKMVSSSKQFEGHVVIEHQPSSKSFVYENLVTETDKRIAVDLGGPLGEYKAYLTYNGEVVSNKQTFTLNADNKVVTGNKPYDTFIPKVNKWLDQDISYCKGTKGYRSPDTNTIWLRDHTYQMRGFRYWEKDMTSAIDEFLNLQKKDGSLPDFLCPTVRVPVEADVEYLAVIAAYQAWQSTGDNEWLLAVLPKLERALNYSLSSPDRWDDQYNLLKRGFTIDTWDFQWGSVGNTINEKTTFGFIVTDNSGIYYASTLLAKMHQAIGDEDKTIKWSQTASKIKENSNQFLWNDEKGYYRSFVHIEKPAPSVTVDESEILTLGNTYAMNRSDFTSHEQAMRIISEYMRRAGELWTDRRGKEHKIFKEWFSIHPNYGYRKFGSGSQAELSGGYVNGGIMPLVGGELSRAAFKHGFENYALEQIDYYIDMTSRAGDKTYLWYWPDGTPGRDEGTIPTDGWGSAAFLASFTEGLLGIVDNSTMFDHVSLTPRWLFAEIDKATVTLRYGASNGYVAYNYRFDEPSNLIEVNTAHSGSKIDLAIPLLKKSRVESITVDDQVVDFDTFMVESSNYAAVSFHSYGHHRILVKLN